MIETGRRNSQQLEKMEGCWVLQGQSAQMLGE